MKKQRRLEPSGYKCGNGFISRYQKLIRDVVIPYQYEVLNDRVDGVEKSHVVANFINAGRVLRGEDAGDGFYGMVFQDSDAAKWLETVAYSLAAFPDSALEDKADELISYIAAAQDEDGYLNTYFTIKDRDKRWTNLCEGHELYCAGHMMEAAAAYYNATGKRVLLDVMLRNAEHIYRHFITEKNEGYSGHPEVELALLKMYRATGNKHCLELAEHFINVRGVDKHFFEKEREKNKWTVWGNNPSDYDYEQYGAPVREQRDATGHSVRAVYLYTGMAELAAETNDAELLNACRRLWESVTEKRMYITGGIGSTVIGEAFTVDYDLPNDTAYAETCASVGLVFFASGMLENGAEGKYADVMERAFYNTVLAGIQLDGKRFFYVNPLEVIPGISGTAATHRHTLTQRPSWYTCACCPPNAARLIMSIGEYAYGENKDTVFCNLFADGEMRFKNGAELVCETDYPYDFTVKYSVKKGGAALALRIPSWSGSFKLLVNGTEYSPELSDGYAYIPRVADGDTVVLTLDGSPKKMYSSVKVAENTGCSAIQRGPLVYCAEGVDNGGEVLSLVLRENGTIECGGFERELLCGTERLYADGYRVRTAEHLYAAEKPIAEPAKITLVPYYCWGNRGETQMRVWLPEK